MNQIQFSFKVYKEKTSLEKLKGVLENNKHLFKGTFVEEHDYYWVTVTEAAPGVDNIDILNYF